MCGGQAGGTNLLLWETREFSAAQQAPALRPPPAPQRGSCAWGLGPKVSACDSKHCQAFKPLALGGAKAHRARASEQSLRLQKG